MAQAVSSRPLTAEARVSPCGICGGRSDWDRFFSELFGFHLTVSIHCDSPLMSRLSIGPVEAAVRRQSHPIDMNNNNSKAYHIHIYI
jgi:hypothetical protein